MPAKVAAIEYDPNRSARIALLHYADGEKRYILWPDGLNGGRHRRRRRERRHPARQRLPLKAIPAGTMIHNIELQPGKGGADGAHRRRRGAADGQGRRLRAGEAALGRGPQVHVDCLATIGQVGNLEHENVSLRQGRPHSAGWAAGRTTAASSMNPVDHPHGGGEGKTSGGRHPVTPWGKPTKGAKTRNNKRTDRVHRARGGSKQWHDH